MPSHGGREAAPGGPARPARELLPVPLLTDRDVLGRVAELISPQAACEEARTLWLLFLDEHGKQVDLIVPVSGFPALPDPSVVAHLFRLTSQALGQAMPGGSAVIAVSRQGDAELTLSDRHILAALQRGAEMHGTPVRMFCLATPGGARVLGPAAPAAGTGPEPGA